MHKISKGAAVTHSRYGEGTVISHITTIKGNEFIRNYVVMFNEYGRLTIPEKELTERS
jgi:hypothetical protein